MKITPWVKRDYLVTAWINWLQTNHGARNNQYLPRTTVLILLQYRFLAINQVRLAAIWFGFDWQVRYKLLKYLIDEFDVGKFKMDQVVKFWS